MGIANNVNSMKLNVVLGYMRFVELTLIQFTVFQ